MSIKYRLKSLHASSVFIAASIFNASLAIATLIHQDFVFPGLLTSILAQMLMTVLIWHHIVIKEKIEWFSSDIQQGLAGQDSTADPLSANATPNGWLSKLSAELSHEQSLAAESARRMELAIHEITARLRTLEEAQSALVSQAQAQLKNHTDVANAVDRMNLEHRRQLAELRRELQLQEPANS